MNAASIETRRGMRRRGDESIAVASLFRRGASCLTLCMLVAFPVSAAGLSDRITEFVEPFEGFAMFNGNLLIDQGGAVVFEGSFGNANYAHRVANTAATRFRIASVSKSITDAAIGRLIDAGDVSLDTALDAFLPDFPSAADITIEHLLTHRSGIPHSNDQPWGDGSESLRLDEIIERLSRLPLDFEPGAERSYSNGGYAVLARILEIATGETFSDALQQLVFEPLEMTDSGHIDDSRAVTEGLATGYEPGPYPGERRQSRFYAVESRPGGGSLYSTAADLHRFAVGVFRNGFLSEETTRLVFDGKRFLSQGRSPGFVAKLYYDKATDIIVVSLANNYAVPADWSAALAELVQGEEAGWPILRQGPVEVSADDPRLGRFTNSFGGGVMAFSRSPRGALVLSDPDDGHLTAMIPLDDGGYLQPLYFQRCKLQSPGRDIDCQMLSGNPRYNSKLSPVATGND